MILRVPSFSGSLSSSIICRGISTAAVLQFRQIVRLQMKVLFLSTMSWLWSKLSSQLPKPEMLKVKGSTISSNSIREFFVLIFCFKSALISEQAFVAFTPIIQSPFEVNRRSFVISKVRGCSERTFLWPKNLISSVIKWLKTLTSKDKYSFIF